MKSSLLTDIQSFLKKIYYFFSPNYKTFFIDFYHFKQSRYTFEKPHQVILAILEKNRDVYITHLNNLQSDIDYFKSIPLKSNGKNLTTPHWHNKYFPGLDAVMLYYFVHHFKPERIIEIGSGTSTLLMYNAIRNFNLSTELISIDPQPRKNIDQLCQNIIRQPLESHTDLTMFENLKTNDILFFDGSHRSLTNSDVTFFFLEILPVLKSGVIVHLHDIYLPYDYPNFMIEKLYNEQYLLAVQLLLTHSKIEILMPCFFVASDKKLNQLLDNFWSNLRPEIETHGGSFWFRV